MGKFTRFNVEAYVLLQEVRSIVTGEKSVSGEIIEFRECSWSDEVELKTLLTVIDLEVELEGLEVYPCIHSMKDMTWVSIN